MRTWLLLSSCVVLTSTAFAAAPVISSVSPETPDVLSPGFEVKVNATDDVGITKVVLLLDGLAYGTDTVAPYTFRVPENLTDGTHNLIAQVHDATTVTVKIWNISTVNRAPVITSLTPGSGAIVAPGFTVTANATDDVRLTQARLLINGVEIVTRTSAPPWQFATETNRIDGQHVVTVEVTDGKHVVEKTAIVNVKRNSNTGTAPTIQILEPVNGAKVNREFRIRAAATDDQKVTKVVLKIDDNVVTERTEPPWEFQAPDLPAGRYYITLEASDATQTVTATQLVYVDEPQDPTLQTTPDERASSLPTSEPIEGGCNGGGLVPSSPVLLWMLAALLSNKRRHAPRAPRSEERH